VKLQTAAVNKNKAPLQVCQKNATIYGVKYGRKIQKTECRHQPIHKPSSTGGH